MTPERSGKIGEKPNDPSVVKGPERWERLPPTKTRSHVSLKIMPRYVINLKTLMEPPS